MSPDEEMLGRPADGVPFVAVTNSGERSVAVQVVNGNVSTGDTTFLSGQAPKVFLGYTPMLNEFPPTLTFTGACRAALSKLGAITINLATATPLTEEEICLKLKDCTASLFVLGFQYGPVAAGSGQSVVETALDACLQLEIPVSVVSIREGDAPIAVPPKFWRDDARDSAQETFRERLSHRELRRYEVETPEELERLIYEVFADLHAVVERGPGRGQPSGPSLPHGLTLDMSSGLAPAPERVRAFRGRLREAVRREVPDHWSDTRFLQHAGVVRNGELTLTGALLFLHAPTAAHPSAVVKCTRYFGYDRSSELRQGAEFWRPVDEQIIGARNWLASQTEIGERVSKSSAATQDVHAYPLVAIRELVANAVVHRDYSDLARCVHIRLFDNRLEITSPGNWMGEALEEEKQYTLDQLVGESAKRNTRLSQLLSWTRLVEGESSGLPTALRNCRETGSPVPTVRQHHGFVTITVLPGRSSRSSASLGSTLVGRGSGKSAAGLTPDPSSVDAPTSGVHNLPHPPNPVFVGRDELLADIAAVFAARPDEPAARGTQAAVGQAIIGLGGVGKSELALRYAASRTGPGALVWWVNAETADTFDLALADLTYRLQPLATTAGWTTPEAARWALSWLQAHTGWLLVLDNVENPTRIAPALATLTTGDILITTRRNIAWSDFGIAALNLDMLPRPASIALLRQRLSPQAADTAARPKPPSTADRTFDEGAADELAAELGDLPLALQQAAGYITAHRLDLTTYLRLLRAQPAVLGKTSPGGSAQPAVSRVFAITMTMLTQSHPQAVALLHGLAWLASVALPRHVITQPDTELDAWLPAAAKNAGTDDELLGLLASYSLINLTPTTVTVHRLLQAAARHHDAATSATPRHRVSSGRTASDVLTDGQTSALAWACSAVPPDPRTNVDGWPLWRDLLPHLDTLFGYLPERLPNSDLAHLLNQTGLYLLTQGRPREALHEQQRALEITEAAVGSHHPDAAISLGNLAFSLSALGRHTDALPLQQRALTITETALGHDHPTTAIRRRDLAGAVGNLARRASALGDQAQHH